MTSPLWNSLFHPQVSRWFEQFVGEPTAVQQRGWVPISKGESALLLAPTGSGKTLAAFLYAIDRLMFGEGDAPRRVLYISPLKALAVDVQKNLQTPIRGIFQLAQEQGLEPHRPSMAIRNGDTLPKDRQKQARNPPDIWITTPESLYLMLSSKVREALYEVDTVIIDEIHTLAPNKRGVHLAVCIERLDRARRLRKPQAPPLQRIALSATQRPLEEVAAILGGGEVSAAQWSPRPVQIIDAGAARSFKLQVELSLDQQLRQAQSMARGSKDSLTTPTRFDVAGTSKRDGQAGEPDELGKASARTEKDPGGLALPQIKALEPEERSTSAGAGLGELEEEAKFPGPVPGDLAPEPPFPIVPAKRAFVSKSVGADVDPGPSDLRSEGKFPGAAAPVQKQDPRNASVWDTIYPKVLEEILDHHSTIVFVNSRRLAERMAEAINTLGNAPLCCAHHGSVAKDQRSEIEDRLKRGALRALIATSSMELGVDMGAVDLVIQIETPPTVASGIQRIGRAAHHVGGVPAGIIFPKFRADLLASAAVVDAMKKGEVEPTRSPQLPLDVLAQHIVSMVCNETWPVDALFDCVRQAYAFRKLSRAQFEGVLDLLDGRYPSREFRGLSARLNWDRISGSLTGRRGAKMAVVGNPGTIPDLGLYPVYLDDGREGKKPARVGELDEEMVLESQVRDVFVLGASSWEIVEIRDDRVMVVPAPGKAGKMPFWRGRGLGRSYSLGKKVGELTRTLASQAPVEAKKKLQEQHSLSQEASTVLVEYIDQQRREGRAIPHDRCIVVEAFQDQLSDWRVCILSPFGARVHMPWAIALAHKWRQELDLDLETMWADDGLVFRFPNHEGEGLPVEDFFPSLEELDDQVLAGLTASSLFAAHFRENAGRSLLLPKRRPGKRTPLWMQRKKSRDLLAIASRYPRFPILLESSRECFQDVFDMPALREVLSRVHAQEIQVNHSVTESPSPFASAILYRYVANFLYDSDAPLAERKAQVLQLDFELLRELLGDAQWQSVLEVEQLDAVHAELQGLRRSHGVSSPDALEDLLRAQGDLSLQEIEQRCNGAAQVDSLPKWLALLQSKTRVCKIRIAAQERWIVASDAGLYRDLFSVVLPPGLPQAFLSPLSEAHNEFLGRYARTRADFRVEELVERYGQSSEFWREHCEAQVDAGRWVRGNFREPELASYCDKSVLDRVRRRSLKHARAEVQPVSTEQFIHFCRHWHELQHPGTGPQGVLDALERLSGMAMPLAEWEWMLSQRVRDFDPMWLDLLCAQGEIMWLAQGPQSGSRSKLALYLREHADQLAPAPVPVDHPLAEKIRDYLRKHGSSRLDDAATRFSVFGPELVELLMQMVGAGELSNDTLAPLRPRASQRSRGFSRHRRSHASLRGRVRDPRLSGRWTLREPVAIDKGRATRMKGAWIEQLLERYGVLLKEQVHQEGFPGGYRAAYPILQEMEDHGAVRRGYFVEGVDAMQFALRGVEAQLRATPVEQEEQGDAWVLSAIDPAQPYGAVLPWPKPSSLQVKTPSPFRREAGARVFFEPNRGLAYLHRSHTRLWQLCPLVGQEESCRRLSQELRKSGVLRLEEIDAEPAHEHPLGLCLQDLGWQRHGSAIRCVGAAAPRPGRSWR